MRLFLLAWVVLLALQFGCRTNRSQPQSTATMPAAATPELAEPSAIAHTAEPTLSMQQQLAGSYRFHPVDEETFDYILEHVYPGAIVLSHDGGGDRSQTVEAYRTVLPALQQQGYVFNTVFLP